MRRLYLTELLGFSDGAVKALGIVFLTVTTCAVIYALWKPLTKQKKRKALLLVLSGICVFAMTGIVILYAAWLRPLWKADSLMQNGNFPEAIEIFEEMKLPDRVKDAQVAYAGVLTAAGENEKAADMIRSIMLTPEAAKLIREHDALKAAVFSPGKAIELSCARQPYGKADGFSWGIGVRSTESEKIFSWNVLEYTDGRALLLSVPLGDECIFRDYYKVQNGEAYEISWDKSDLRAMLNGEVYGSFDEKIRSAILPTQHTGKGCKISAYNKEEIIETFEYVSEDWLFLLECKETERYSAWLLELAKESEYLSWTSTPGEMAFNQNSMKTIHPASDGQYTIKDQSIFDRASVCAAMWVDVNVLLQNH